MHIRKLAALAGATAVFVGACSSNSGGATATTAPVAAAAGGLHHRDVLEQLQEERWAKWDGPP